MAHLYRSFTASRGRWNTNSHEHSFYHIRCARIHHTKINADSIRHRSTDNSSNQHPLLCFYLSTKKFMILCHIPNMWKQCPGRFWAKLSGEIQVFPWRFSHLRSFLRIIFKIHHKLVQRKPKDVTDRDPSL